MRKLLLILFMGLSVASKAQTLAIYTGDTTQVCGVMANDQILPLGKKNSKYKVTIGKDWATFEEEGAKSIRKMLIMEVHFKPQGTIYMGVAYYLNNEAEVLKWTQEDYNTYFAALYVYDDTIKFRWQYFEFVFYRTPTGKWGNP